MPGSSGETNIASNVILKVPSPLSIISPAWIAVPFQVPESSRGPGDPYPAGHGGIFSGNA